MSSFLHNKLDEISRKSLNVKYMKSDVIPIYKEGQSCILTVDKEINDTTIKKGSVVTIEAIELTDSKFADLDEIYLVDYIDFTFWVYQNELESASSNNDKNECI